MADRINPWERLANAIIIKAVDDYCKAQKALKRDPDDYIAKGSIGQIESFFHSSYYSKLSKVDGELIIEKLRKGEGHEERRGRSSSHYTVKLDY